MEEDEEALVDRLEAVDAVDLAVVGVAVEDQEAVDVADPLDDKNIRIHFCLEFVRVQNAPHDFCTLFRFCIDRCVV